jgi:hypothetical protein|tara:strand:+ start:2337 stop:2849 length:513 start_codon:yes stop_codon:yes gene_type:complete
MQYSITGHTQGIGKCLFDRLSPNAVGFSKSTGYDVTKRDDIFRILDESEQCDVFVNNAYEDFSQSNMLLEAFYRWKDTNKIIINVGSQIAEDKINLKHHKEVGLMTYQMHKASLKKLHEDIVKYECKMQSKYVWFGYVATENILKKYPNMPQRMLISTDKAVDKILGVLE